jgi:NADP-dependent 3-hydroxy acid dehydrogenase YdfG
MAQAVLERGWNAVATARDPASVEEIVAAHPEHALALPLDVTKRDQIASAVREAEHRFGSIDVLVNNAGYGFRSAVEEADEDDVAKLFDTNFFGLVALTKAVLPGMRAQRSGTIVNMSSTAGRISNPGSGYYSATKFAIAGLSDALRKEVAPLGIKVIVVEPSAFRTDFSGRSLQQSRTPIEDYASTAGRRRKENDTVHGRQAGDPVRGAQAIIKVVESDNPPARLALGRGAVERIAAELKAHLRELETWAELGISADYPREQ